MTAALFIEHSHQPLYRVIRSGWVANAMESSFSQRARDNRWNDSSFPALYCCCSEAVARAVAHDVLRFAGVEIDELQEAARPCLVELSWDGTVVDVTTPEGVARAGFPPDYPGSASKDQTRAAAATWQAARLEGVVCRSASLHRLGMRTWNGAHERWSELALFVRNGKKAPELLLARTDLDWFWSSPQKLT